MTIKYNRGSYTDDFLLKFYRELLIPRIIEERMILLLRQGKISKWFSGIGQEAVSVGAAMALDEDEFLMPMHRNLGMFTVRKIPLDRLFSQFQGKMNGYTKGRDRSFHFGAIDHHIVGMISHLGAQMGVADGIALGELLGKSQKVTLVITGDGGTSEGEFHEALNIAAVWNLPVIFLIENNGYGLSTPSSEQFKFKSFTDKGKGYGMDAVSIDGNNILAVYEEVGKLAKTIRKNPKPVILECRTFRMRGHEEASGTKYVPAKLTEQWAAKDPVENFKKFLIREGVIDEKIHQKLKNTIEKEVACGWNKANSEPEISCDPKRELDDLFAPCTFIETKPASQNIKEKRYVDAIRDGLFQCMQKFKNLVLMGQDIAEYGGVFKVTEGFLKEFGKERVRNTPLCESAIAGAALGLSIKGFKPVVEMQFADFVSCGFNQIVNNLAKIHWRWGQNADVVIRMPTGAGVSAGPFHSQSNEAWFFHTPGLKVVYPAFPADAKGLLAASIEDTNPVLFFEHKALYRTVKEMVHDDYYTLELGKAKMLREGNDLTIITYGMGVHWAMEVLNETSISADLIDLRTLMPYDKETLVASVKKTGKVIILHEDTLVGGIGAELASFITETCFEFLDAPVMRSASIDTPVPFAAELESNFLPAQRFKEQLKKLTEY